MDLYTWIKNQEQEYITVHEVNKWSCGHKEEVVIFDENFESVYLWDNLSKNEKYHIRDVLRYNRSTIEYMGNFQWKIKYCGKEEIIVSVHAIFTPDICSEEWAELDEKGCIDIHSSDCEDEECEDENCLQKSHFSEYDELWAGWKGPMIKWNNISFTTKIIISFDSFVRKIHSKLNFFGISKNHNSVR